MKYEIVTLEKKTLVGISTKTGNDDPHMQETIAELWKRFHQEDIYSKILTPSSPHAIGLYSDYAANGYTVTVGYEVANENSTIQGSEFIQKHIPYGKYAKFTVEGSVDAAVSDAWNKIWCTNLNRSFTGDFEEYVDVISPTNAKINIYIALKE